ncbi:hypothetical protein PoB_002910900 [Plakobranchus ocellatus]|uniref:Uncharacterized protein n=1 Tax=Plakobranchus ocellatus TaxID=259542 RepID=A0AAV4A7W2_9GAST|nr:hypothetical protein PoB_002910900 [Plakobranchus ocellatus]
MTILGDFKAKVWNERIEDVGPSDMETVRVSYSYLSPDLLTNCQAEPNLLPLTFVSIDTALSPYQIQLQLKKLWPVGQFSSTSTGPTLLLFSFVMLNHQHCLSHCLTVSLYG